jgi:hypothetical protein
MTATLVVIAPVAVFSAMPVGQVPDCAIVALPLTPKVAATELTLSFAATLAIGVEAVPAIAVPFSSTGTILPVTVTVSIAVLQLTGVLLSQS